MTSPAKALSMSWPRCASEAPLAGLHRTLSQGTYYALQDESLRLAV